MSQPDDQGGDWPVETFDGSPARSLLLAAGGVAMSVLAAAIALGAFRPPGPFLTALGVVGAIFFAVCAVLWAARAMRTAAVVSVGPQGVRDSRLAEDWIPWPEIHGIDIVTINRIRFFMLDVDPEFQGSLRLSPLARVGQWGNAKLGYRGMLIDSQGLRGGFKDLEAALELGYARARAELQTRSP